MLYSRIKENGKKKASLAGELASIGKSQVKSFNNLLKSDFATNASLAGIGLGASGIGYGLRKGTEGVDKPMEEATQVLEDFKDRFGAEAVRNYEHFDPDKPTYKQWKMLRSSKFLYPYISSAVPGLQSKVFPGVEGFDIVTNLRRLANIYPEPAVKHYFSFKKGPKGALEILSSEGLADHKARGFKRAAKGLLEDYEILKNKHGDFEAVKKLYDMPWAKVDLSNPENAERYRQEFGDKALKESLKKQALLFYATKVKLFAPSRWEHVISGINATGRGLELGGALTASLGGVGALRALTKKGAESQPNAISTLVSGANPFSTEVDELALKYDPKSKTDEVRHVAPGILGKALLGAIVVPSLARGGIEGIRGVMRQGPYKNVTRLAGLGKGTLHGLKLPAKSIISAIRASRLSNKALKGDPLDKLEAMTLAKQVEQVPISKSRHVAPVLKKLQQGKGITPQEAQDLRKGMFETNATILLNSLIGGALTGYGGYSSYKRTKDIRSAFEELSGKLTSEELAALKNPALRKEYKRRRKAYKN